MVLKMTKGDGDEVCVKSLPENMGPKISWIWPGLDAGGPHLILSPLPPSWRTGTRGAIFLSEVVNIKLFPFRQQVVCEFKDTRLIVTTVLSSIILQLRWFVQWCSAYIQRKFKPAVGFGTRAVTVALRPAGTRLRFSVFRCKSAKEF